MVVEVRVQWRTSQTSSSIRTPGERDTPWRPEQTPRRNWGELFPTGECSRGDLQRRHLSSIATKTRGAAFYRSPRNCFALAYVSQTQSAHTRGRATPARYISCALHYWSGVGGDHRLAVHQPRHFEVARNSSARNHRIGATTRDEFGQLAHAFDQMTENLSASRDELEKEVGERKRAEAVLAQQAEELERSNQELDSFAHTASHDLKAPARRMAQFCQLLERKCKGVLDEKASGYISIIADNAAQMRTLIDDVLVFAKAGTGPREVGAVDLNTVARRAKTNLEMEIAESGAEVQVDILPTVAGHETDILLLFQNLIANAVKFCGENTPKVTVAAHLTDDVWDIEVRDDGIGIDATNQERIFAPLTRLHTAGEYQGSGIGLATCKKIVERNGGQIRVRSKSGCGSSFHFTLPTSTTNEAA